jgi:transposase
MDTSKYLFTPHGVDEPGEVVLRRELRRGQVETFFRKLPSTDVVLEACGGSHHWGRVLGGLGHQVRLIPPQYAKPFVKRGKNDHIDAEAICEGALRPGMTFVPVKSAETQANAMVLSVRELLVKQQTQAINALPGHANEFGAVATSCPGDVRRIQFACRRIISTLVGTGPQTDRAAQGQPGQLLAEVPGIGPISALTLAMTVDAPAIQVRAALRRLARSDSEAKVNRRQAAAGWDLPSR